MRFGNKQQYRVLFMRIYDIQNVPRIVNDFNVFFKEFEADF